MNRRYFNSWYDRRYDSPYRYYNGYNRLEVSKRIHGMFSLLLIVSISHLAHSVVFTGTVATEAMVATAVDMAAATTTAQEWKWPVCVECVIMVAMAAATVAMVATADMVDMVVATADMAVGTTTVTTKPRLAIRCIDGCALEIEDLLV